MIYFHGRILRAGNQGMRSSRLAQLTTPQPTKTVDVKYTQDMQNDQLGLNVRVPMFRPGTWAGRLRARNQARAQRERERGKEKDKQGYIHNETSCIKDACHG